MTLANQPISTKKSVFDLNKLERSAPTWSGMMLRFLSWILSSVLGYPLHSYLAKSNLEPIEKAEIDEDPTFYPCFPIPHNISEGDSVGEIEWQYQFLVDNYICSPHFKSILDYHEVYLSKKMTPEDVVNMAEKKIIESEQHSPPLRCFTQLNMELARQAARESALRYVNGRPLSVLDGIPIGVKDEYDVKDFRTSHGRAVEGDVNTADSSVVGALRSYGAIIIGITNMHEMGMGITGINPHHGATRNPYNDNHVTGGSSSGSATAVAAGIIPLALGSDGGGSVRIPAAFCGMSGIKPTFGRLSATGTGFSLSTVTAAGVIANNATDMALVYSLIANKVPDPRFFHHNSPITQVKCFSDKSFAEIKFGTYSEYTAACEKEVISVFKNNVLPKLPNPVIEIELEQLYLSKIAHMNIILSETAQNLQIFREHGSELACQTKLVFIVCERLKLKNYMNSSCQKTRAMNMFRALFEKIDVLITPTTACLPKEIDPASLSYGELDEVNVLYTMWFVYLANLCGLPSVTLNAGYSTSGLPVGVMITAAWWKEDILLRVAKSLETSLRKPQRHYQTLVREENID